MKIVRQGRKSEATVLRHYVTILIATSTTDEEGGFTQAWADGNTIAASVDPILARQQFDYKSIGVTATHWIKVRGEIEVIEENRLRFGTRIFEILTIENIQETNFIKFITCKETR
jgi:SPP1 family predicted phage head-tail adaptor